MTLTPAVRPSITLALALALGLMARAAEAQTYPQVHGPGGSVVPPAPVALLGLDALSGAACLVGATATCQAPSTGALQASGQIMVTSTITAPAQSASFIPLAGRTAYLTLSGTGTGSCQLEAQFDGANWARLMVGAGGSMVQLNTYTLTGSGVISDQFVIAQAGVPVRLNCAAGVTGGGWTAGAITVSFSQ